MSDESVRNNNGHESAFWESQLSGLDFSGLPEPPAATDSPPDAQRSLVPVANEQVNTNQQLLLLAALASTYKQARENPGIYQEALIIARRANGSYRIIFPSSYSKETLLGLAEAALRFAGMLSEEQ